jgi:DNA-binding XRE family transcriptional regulator
VKERRLKTAWGQTGWGVFLPELFLGPTDSGRNRPVLALFMIDLEVCVFDITGRRLRQARGLLGLSRPELAKAVGVSKKSIELWEGADAEPPAARSRNLGALVRYLAKCGVEFTNAGVRSEEGAA